MRRIYSHARLEGAGKRYLIQHSAGSGKSFTIALLAHQLATLHDANDRRVFDSIVVVTRSAVFCGTRWPAPAIAMTVFGRRVLPPGLSRHGNNCRPAVVFDIVEHVSTL